MKKVRGVHTCAGLASVVKVVTCVFIGDEGMRAEPKNAIAISDNKCTEELHRRGYLVSQLGFLESISFATR